MIILGNSKTIKYTPIFEDVKLTVNTNDGSKINPPSTPLIFDFSIDKYTPLPLTVNTNDGSKINPPSTPLIFDFSIDKSTPLPDGVSFNSKNNVITIDAANSKINSITNTYLILGKVNFKEKKYTYVGTITNKEKLAFVNPIALRSSKNGDGFDKGEAISKEFRKTGINNGAFPKISWSGFPSKYFLLMFQEDAQKDLTRDEKRARGFWLIENNINEISKTPGQYGDGEKQVLKINGITALEYFLAPIRSGNYRYKIYAINGIEKEEITDKLLNPISTYNPNFDTNPVQTKDRANDIEKTLSDYILSGSEIEFHVKDELFFTTFAVINGILFHSYGYDFENDRGNLDFPSLEFKNFPNNTQSLALIYQDENNKTWGHGIWVLENTINTIAKKGGSVTKDGSGNITAVTHATLSGIQGVSVIESYFAATPPNTGLNPLPHTYKFSLIATSLSKNDLTTLLTKYKRTAPFDPNNGTGGVAPNTVDGKNVVDRIASIKTALGDHLLEEKEISFNYPR